VLFQALYAEKLRANGFVNFSEDVLSLGDAGHYFSTELMKALERVDRVLSTHYNTT